MNIFSRLKTIDKFNNKNVLSKFTSDKDILYRWRPTSLSELIHIKFNTELTHLGSDASKYCIVIFYNKSYILFQNSINIFLFFSSKFYILNIISTFIAYLDYKVVLYMKFINLVMDTHNFIYNLKF